MKRVMFLVLIGACLLLLGAGEYKRLWTGDGTAPDSIMGVISDSGDTARIVRLDLKLALDSFPYTCTLSIPGLGADSLMDLSWTSPVQTMILTPDTVTLGMDSIVYADTFVFAADYDVTFTSGEHTIKVTPTTAMDDSQYTCSVYLAADTFVSTWTAPAAATSIAMICDSMVDSINNTTTLKDSVYAEDSTTYYIIRPAFGSRVFSTRIAAATQDTAQTITTSFATTAAMLVDSMVSVINAKAVLTDSVSAEDSVSYVKCVSLFGQLKFGGTRWSFQFNDSLRDSSDQAPNVVADMIDSVVATINAHDSGANYVTAYDSTTYYRIIADDKGVPFFLQDGGGLAFHADTLDTTHNQNNVMARYSDDDTVNIGTTDGFSTLQGRVILYDARTPEVLASGCLGNDDSARIWVYSGRAGSYYLVDSGLFATIPCTLDVEVIGTVGDTLLEHELYIRVWRDDSCTINTTPGAIAHRYTWDFKLK